MEYSVFTLSSVFQIFIIKPKKTQKFTYGQ